MAISHLCFHCGLDLARVRPQIDHHYGLPLLICPRCGTVAVRRRHPVQRRWRQSQRLVRVLALLLFQFIMLGVLLSLVVAVAVNFSDDFALRMLDRVEPVILTYTFVVLPLALGTWLIAGLPHWTPLQAWLTFAALVTVLISCDVIIWPMLETAAASLGIEGVRPRRINSAAWGWRLAVVGVIMIASLPGIIFGRAARSFFIYARAAQWRGRRRRLRLRRAAG